MSEVLDTTLLASELRVVIGQLIRRLRRVHAISLSQGSALGRLDREGACSIGDLAASEYVRPQSMTQTVSDMEADGLVVRRSDPADGRRILVELTDRGRLRLQEDRRQRDGWLATAIVEDLSLQEQQLLADALVLLQRLAQG